MFWTLHCNKSWIEMNSVRLRIANLIIYSITLYTVYNNKGSPRFDEYVYQTVKSFVYIGLNLH